MAVYRFIASYKKKKFRDNSVTVEDNATIQRKSREKDLSMRKRGLKADVCGRMVKKERKGKKREMRRETTNWYGGS